MAQIAVGQGRLGLVSGLKDFDEFIDQTDPQRDAYVQIRPIKEVTDWSLDTGSTYVAGFSFPFKGVTRDVVGVKSLVDPAGLTRVETLALCRATAGTFFYDIHEEFSGPVGSWDDTVPPVWQIATWAFDGSSHISKGSMLEGLVDGQAGTFSCWFKITDNGATQIFMALGSSIRFFVAIGVSGDISIQGKDTSGTLNLVIASDPGFDDGNWHHLAASWNNATSAVHLLIDGVDRLSGSAQAPTDIDYTSDDCYIGHVVTSLPVLGELGQVYFDTTYLDLSVAANLAKLIKASNSKPTDLEQDGSGPTGSSPLLYMHSNVDDILENSGTGGDFVTETSDVTVGLTTPVNPSGSMLWDQFHMLYIHQSDGSDPSDSTVVAVHAFYFANKGTWQPSLSGNKFTNGGFEANTFDDSTPPTDWTVAKNAGTPTLSLGTTDPREGDQYPIMNLGTTSDKMSIYQTSDPAIVPGALYRFSGWYWTNGPDAQVIIAEASDTNDSLNINGRDEETNDDNWDNLDATGGTWKRFVFDIRIPDSWADATPRVRGDATGGTTGMVRWDGLSFQRIWRFNFYEPRLTSASLPPVETSSSDIFFGGKSIGSGSISLINSDGLLEELVAELEWMNQESLIDVGGTFIDPGDNTQEIDAGDFFRQMTGLIQDITITDDLATFSLQDKRVFFHQLLPPRTYDDAVFPGMDLALQGNVRPLWFGVKNNIPPARIALTANDYGTYELADADRSPAGIKQISKVYAYLDTNAADIQNPTKRLLLVSGTDYSEDLANAQFSIIRDVGPYLIDPTNKFMDYDEGAAEINATLTEGMYTATLLATEIQTQLNASGASDWTVTYSNTTHKFTIAKAAGTGNLLAKTGTNREAGPWKFIGFNTSADYSVGGGSQEGQNPTFEDVDGTHLLRVNGIGFKDDGSGTFTGVASNSIEIGSDVLRTLLIQYLDKPASIIDETSFQFARDRAPESISMYLNESLDTREIFDRLEFSNIANIIIDGSGKIFIKVYIGTVPADIKTLTDADFQQFSSGRATNEVFTTIKVQFDQDPSTGEFEIREATDASVSIRLGRPEIKEIPTFLKIDDNALSVANRMLELASNAARRVEGIVLGSKMMRLEVGDKFKITRRRALAIGGQITDEVFRVISIGKSALTGRTTFTATDDRITVASQACATTCQAFCEESCQTTCQQSCQETCEINCQQACETSCQEACQLGCQQSCQLGCQTTCEGSCQETCQLGCQGACEGAGCQTACENTCQTACETSCQDACQSACQTVCQTTECQTNCQTSCQETCETVCQTTCQTSCQQTCELNCQNLCQTSCQSSCQFSCETQREACQESCQFASESP